MLRQIEHLFLFTFIMLGTAVPVLFFISLLAFGIILDNDSSSTQLLFIVWAVIMSQCMLLLIAKQAILGSRYRYYLASVEKSIIKRFIGDLALTLLCSPITLLYVFVLVSIEPAHWGEIPHAFLCLLLLLVGSFVCLYKPKGLYAFLGAALCSIPLLSSQSFVFGLAIFCVLQMLVIAVYLRGKSILSTFTFALPIKWMFWLSLSIGAHEGTSQTGASMHKPNNLLSACAIATLLIIMTHYSAKNLPEYIQSVNFIGAQLIVLSTASLQISVQKMIRAYPLFFAGYLSVPTFSRGQYWVSIATSFFMLIVASLVFKSPIVLLHLLSTFCCIYFAKMLPKFFIFSWALSSAFVGLMIYTIM